MRLTIEESGIIFGEFDEGKFFQIEKSTIYQSLGKCPKSVEFILLHSKDRELIWLEAKSSSPKPGSKINFDAFISEIHDKFVHSLELYFSILTERMLDKNKEFPVCFKKIDYTTTSMKFILVINGHKEAWLSPIADALKQSLCVQIKIWRLSVSVVNEQHASQMGLTLN
jgi:hypothetical protein